MGSRSLWVTLAMMFFSTSAYAEGKVLSLPAPRTEGGKPLMQCLKERRSRREFSPKVLPDQVLSDLLWAADGVTRPDGKRTAPTAMDAREIEVYVAKADGLYRYDPDRHNLVQESSDDIRQATGAQPFVRECPVDLVYVVDESKTGKFGGNKDIYAGTDTAFIAGNVYLFCASEGLATVVRGSFDQEKLSAAMHLGKGKKIVLTQSVGYPK